jgi:hypothetical protein
MPDVVTHTNGEWFLLQCFFPDTSLIGETQDRKPFFYSVIETIEESFGKCRQLKDSKFSLVIFAKVEWYCDNEEAQKYLSSLKNGPLLLKQLEFRIIV